MKSSGGKETGDALEDGQAPEEVIEMVKKKVVEVRGGGSDAHGSDSKLNPDKSVGKELLKRIREFRER